MALTEGRSSAEALRRGTAMACATALAPGTLLATPKEFCRLLRQTEMQEI